MFIEVGLGVYSFRYPHLGDRWKRFINALIASVGQLLAAYTWVIVGNANVSSFL